MTCIYTHAHTCACSAWENHPVSNMPGCILSVCNPRPPPVRSLALGAGVPKPPCRASWVISQGGEGLTRQETVVVLVKHMNPHVSQRLEGK